jgi:hypothetical protein
MRRLVFFIVIFILSINVSSQETDEPADTAAAEEFVTFTYTVLPPEMTNSFFKVSHDTVFFRVVYVDVMCNDYQYEFRHEGISLIVQRVTVDLSGCDEETDQIYAFDGTFTNVPEGKSLFELESVYGGKKNSLFREVIIVK